MAWCALALSFPWSNSFMSIATGLLGLVALIELMEPTGRMPGARFQRLSGLALVALVALSGASASWSLDRALALHDVRVKLPLAVGGLVLLAARGSTMLNTDSVRRILRCAVFSATAATWTLVFLDVLDGNLWRTPCFPVHFSHSIRALWPHCFHLRRTGFQEGGL